MTNQTIKNQNSIPANSHDAYILMEKAIYKIARQYTKNNFQDFDDLCTAGRIGLMKAWNTYDPSKSTAKFNTYAQRCIWVEIKDAAVFDWKVYNNTHSYITSDDMEVFEDAYDTNWDEEIEMEQRINKMDDLDRSIVQLRMMGHTFREISEMTDGALTLHQIRNRYMEATAS